jgi:cation transport ATPase
MGAAGSDAALETADIALTADDLAKIPWLIRHARRTLGVIHQNIAFSLTVRGLFVLLTFTDKRPDKQGWFHTSFYAPNAQCTDCLARLH